MQALIQRAAAGDAGALYEANLGLIRRIVDGYGSLCAMDGAIDADDLLQVSYFAVIRAAQTYNPEAGGSWAHWLVYFLRREINNALGRRNGRFLRPDHGSVSLDEPLDSEDDGSATRLDELADDTLPDHAEELLAGEIVRGVRAAIERLPSEQQRAAVAAVDLEGMTLAEAGRRMEITPGTVQGNLRRAYRNLRRDTELIRLKDAYCIAPPSYWQYRGVSSFLSSWTSATENAALWCASES